MTQPACGESNKTMQDTNTNSRLDPKPTASPVMLKPSRKRRAVTPRAPRQIDPGVKAIRDKAAAEVRDYHKALASAGVLKRIVAQPQNKSQLKKWNYWSYANKQRKMEGQNTT